MPQISKLVRNAIYDRLTDGVLGYDRKLAASAPGYDPPIDTRVLLIGDWSAGGPHFLFGRIPPDLIESSSVLSYPVCTIDTLRTTSGSGPGRWTMSSTFAGLIDAVIDVHISWPESAAIADFASYGDLVEDAMFAALNNPVQLLSAAGLAYSGRLSLVRGPIVMAGENWRQTLTFTAPFAVNT